jgi:metallophosphoesterase (TIGR03767 family)
MSSTNFQRIEMVRELNSQGVETTRLVNKPGEPVLGDAPDVTEVLATFIHFSDIHICDTQSPARLEFLDRLADPDHPMQPIVKYIGTYRPHEFLSVQVAESMVQAANEIKMGPLAGGRIDAVVVTGDVTDNGQHNELTWYKTILDGGPIHPTSGNAHGEFDGPASNSPETWDVHYYHPDFAPDGLEEDRPKTKFGVPAFPGLLDASRSPFIAQGLEHRWLAIHGNHDALLQGVAVPNEYVSDLVVGNQKLNAMSATANLEEFFGHFGEVGPATYGNPSDIDTRTIASDPARRFTQIEDWVSIHNGCGHDHGLNGNASDQAYFARDIGEHVRFIALDTVNAHGGWQGCIDQAQFAWLRETLDKSRDKYVVLASHHPLQDLFNGYAPDGVAAPVLKDQVLELLLQHKNVILWASGHVHDNHISTATAPDGSVGFWQIRAASLIDWPQQGRTIEIVRSSDGRLAIGTVVIDHAAPLDFTADGEWLSDPVALAGASRLIAANDWQRQGADPNFDEWTGTADDRNRWLWLEDPLA